MLVSEQIQFQLYLQNTIWNTRKTKLFYPEMALFGWIQDQNRCFTYFRLEYSSPSLLYCKKKIIPPKFVNNCHILTKGPPPPPRDEHEYSNIQIYWASNKYLYLNSYIIDIRIYSNICLMIKIYLQIFLFSVLLQFSHNVIF